MIRIIEEFSSWIGGRVDRWIGGSAAWGSILFVTLASLPVASAEFIVKSQMVSKYSSYVNTQSVCQYEMIGVIGEGDADAFRQFLADKDTGQLPTVLCLNSRGGSLGQAVEIAELAIMHKIGTMIQKDAKCLSSCSFVFMAGSAPDLTISAEPKAFIWRVLQPGGILGIHRPDLPIDGRRLTTEFVQDVYGVALATVSRVIKVLATSGFLSDGAQVKQSFLLSWLTTPFQEMRYVETVDDIGRWQIAINTPRFLPELADEVLALGCRNALAWQQDLSAISAKTWDGNVLPSVKTTDKYGRLLIKMWANPSSGEGCTFYGASGSDVKAASQLYWLDITGPGGKSGVEVFPYFFADPRTKIRAFE